MSNETSQIAPLRIAVVYATLGRAEILRQTVLQLDQQFRRPDAVLVIGTTPDDVTGLAEACPDAEIVFAERGLCRQRNAALDRLREAYDVAVFFDDDFVPAPDYLAQVERLLLSHSELTGLTGRLVGDGAHTGEISFSKALAMLDPSMPRPSEPDADCTWLYGCNMVIRLDAAQGLRFDETLPLYGWQEDVDFSNQLARRGRMLRTADLTGVHLGTSGGRTSGVRLGYSQVANILYLRRKGTIAFSHGIPLMARNIVANLAKSLGPEPGIDRRGRLAGNALAFRDWLRGTLDPRRIEHL